MLMRTVAFLVFRRVLVLVGLGPVRPRKTWRSRCCVISRWCCRAGSPARGLGGPTIGRAARVVLRRAVTDASHSCTPGRLGGDVSGVRRWAAGLDANAGVLHGYCLRTG
jgi:hypothetical protein